MNNMDKNTFDFYKELNNQYKGIFLNKPLFYYDKIKNNESIIEIIINVFAHKVNIKRNILYDENTFMEGLSEECLEEQQLNNVKKLYNNPLDYDYFSVCKDDPTIK
ncbi:hypothetical protein BCR32DRAFT_274683 [Anaeromyces robustus]|uniref:Uncharacterized protein n=1 Tax=Anaeromyces robustus TaxID=1754192 RepID=A0A1Y1XN86_9FUNG|nr:hypothetical protein BCR32DRAFT_274683 [Anaeromyces robustus]|eukprot:ORX87220.1 hypothetical protein BCR32DRAFT_274683 [Anaeromyces robustus]